LLTLYITPVIYLYLDRFVKATRRRPGKSPAPVTEEIYASH
jgi:hypothetical protein